MENEIKPRPKQTTPIILLVEKLRRFQIFHYILITELFLKAHIKGSLAYSWCLINVWRTFASNYYQGFQNYRTISEIAKNFAKTCINNYVQSFCETTSRLWRHKLWWGLQQNISPEKWVYSIQCLSSPIRRYSRIINRKALPWIKLEITPTLTYLNPSNVVQETFFIQGVSQESKNLCVLHESGKT